MDLAKAFQKVMRCAGIAIALVVRPNEAVEESVYSFA
jgi:hypothetical protein